jgi:hypothetical protein
MPVHLDISFTFQPRPLRLTKGNIMNYKKSRSVLWLLALLAFSGQATAGTQALGTLLNGSSTTFGTGNIGSGSFTDYVTFNVLTTSLDAIATTLSNGNSGIINNFSVSLYGVGPENTLTLLETGIATPFTVPPISHGGKPSYGVVDTIPTINLSGGNYELKITGTGPTIGKASFSGNISPVPEPSEGALLLSGLGLLGFIAVRRGRSEA